MVSARIGWLLQNGSKQKRRSCVVFVREYSASEDVLSINDGIILFSYSLDESLGTLPDASIFRCFLLIPFKIPFLAKNKYNIFSV